MVNKFSSQKGVAILFAVLLVSVVLTVSLGLYNIVYRQLVLSSLARESEIAFAIADSARNCALYWDSPERDANQRPFGYYQFNNGSWSFVPPDESVNFSCAGLSLNVTTSENDGNDGDNGNPGNPGNPGNNTGGPKGGVGLDEIDVGGVVEVGQGITGTAVDGTEIDFNDNQIFLSEDAVVSRFYLRASMGTGGSARTACAEVIVAKNPDNTGTDQLTEITANGYNISSGAATGDCTPTDINRAVQRTIVTEING